MPKEKPEAKAVANVIQTAVGPIAVSIPPTAPTREALQTEMKALVMSGKYLEAADIGAKIKAIEAAAVATALAAKQAALAKTVVAVQGRLVKVVESMIADKTLDGADGVWFSVDFGQMVDGKHVANLRLLKVSAVSTRAKGEPKPKAANGDRVSTVDLVKANATKAITWKNAPSTVQAAYDSIQVIRETAKTASDAEGSGAPGKDGRARTAKEVLNKQVNDEEWQLRGKILA